MSKVLDKWILNQYFSDFASHESPGILLDGDTHSEGLEWGLRAHVLHQLSDDLPASRWIQEPKTGALPVFFKLHKTSNGINSKFSNDSIRVE